MGADYGDRANEDIIVMPMIETAEAMKNLDDILSVPGVDAVYVGPSDLSLAFGCKPRLDQTDAPVVEAQQVIAKACKKHGVIAGIHNATAAYAVKMIAEGYQFVTLASDSRFMAAKCRRGSRSQAGSTGTRGRRSSPGRPTWRGTGTPGRFDRLRRSAFDEGCGANLAAFDRRAAARRGAQGRRGGRGPASR